MGSFADVTEPKILNHVLKGTAFTQPAGLYAALSLNDPTDSGSGFLEPSGSGYARVSTGAWNAAASRSIANTADITFAAATGAWGTCAYWGVYDAITSGNLIAYGTLTLPKTVIATNIPIINAGDMVVYFTSGAVSTWLANKLLDHCFKNTAYSQPTHICAALSTASPGDSGSTIAEPVGNAYARYTMDVWNAASTGVCSSSNTNPIIFVAASGSWNTISHMVFFDALTGGNFLMYGAVSSPQLVTTGDIPQWSAGQVIITLD